RESAAVPGRQRLVDRAGPGRQRSEHRQRRDISPSPAPPWRDKNLAADRKTTAPPAGPAAGSQGTAPRSPGKAKYPTVSGASSVAPEVLQVIHIQPPLQIGIIRYDDLGQVAAAGNALAQGLRQGRLADE